MVELPRFGGKMELAPSPAAYLWPICLDSRPWSYYNGGPNTRDTLDIDLLSLLVLFCRSCHSNWNVMDYFRYIIDKHISHSPKHANKMLALNCRFWHSVLFSPMLWRRVRGAEIKILSQRPAWTCCSKDMSERCSRFRTRDSETYSYYMIAVADSGAWQLNVRAPYSDRVKKHDR
jgi:hypothetical protein